MRFFNLLIFKIGDIASLMFCSPHKTEIKTRVSGKRQKCYEADFVPRLFHSCRDTATCFLELTTREAMNSFKVGLIYIK